MARIAEIPHGEIIGKTLMLFTQTARLISKYIDVEFYNKVHLSFIKFLVLTTLASRNGVMTPTQIAEWSQTELHNITTLVARLKKEGLVYTERSDIDKRSVNVFLTDKGRTVQNLAMPVARELIDKIMSSITETDALIFTQMLEVLRDNTYGGLESIARDS
ncbi:MarR family winged helix-turn-helix transcriptional regulator [Chloroflexota bacterium]